MTRTLWLIIPAIGVLAALLGTALPVGIAVVVAVGIGVAATLLVRLRARTHIRRLTRHISRWLEDEADREPIRFTRGAEWRELSVALNTLARALTHLEHQHVRAPRWRDELVETLITPTLLFDADDRLVTANDAAREMLGADPARATTIIETVGSSAVADAAGEARATDGRVTVDAPVAGREARVAVASLGQEVLVLITDRSREQRVEDVRRNFVVNASHELKTPAATIQILADALGVAVDRDPDRARELVTRLAEESERLGRMVRELLDLRRLEEDAPNERSMVDLAVVARRAAAELADRAAARDIAIRVDAPEPALIAAVPDDVELIVHNLIANAIQYNREGGSVEVHVEPHGHGYELEVTDTGLGIPQQDLQRIFERFYRVDVARSRETGGTGLGLSIVRNSVERHGGTIQVASLLGEGSTFTVALPVEATEAGEARRRLR